MNDVCLCRVELVQAGDMGQDHGLEYVLFMYDNGSCGIVPGLLATLLVISVSSSDR